MSTIAQPWLQVQTAEQPQPAVPSWFAETILSAQYLRTHGLLEAIMTQVRLVRGRWGRYESSDFLALLFGYAIGGQRTLPPYVGRLASGGTPFMALFAREALPQRPHPSFESRQENACRICASTNGWARAATALNTPVISAWMA